MHGAVLTAAPQPESPSCTVTFLSGCDCASRAQANLPTDKEGSEVRMDLVMFRPHCHGGPAPPPSGRASGVKTADRDPDHPQSLHPCPRLSVSTPGRTGPAGLGWGPSWDSPCQSSRYRDCLSVKENSLFPRSLPHLSLVFQRLTNRQKYIYLGIIYIEN